MGKYLNDTELRKLKIYMTIYLSLPFCEDLPGEAFEQMYAAARGGQWQGKRANRPEPDVVLNGKNYSIKTEKIQREHVSASDLLGKRLDIITARPDPSDLLPADQNIAALSDNELGRLVLRHYNERIVQRYRWDVIGILFRLKDNREFIYFEKPAQLYDINAYRWESTKRAKGDNRNIAGYDHQGIQWFRWTSRGKQLYVVHEIPQDAEVFAIQIQKISIEELQQILSNKIHLI
jgi:hypothetical protein